MSSFFKNDCENAEKKAWLLISMSLHEFFGNMTSVVFLMNRGHAIWLLIRDNNGGEWVW